MSIFKKYPNVLYTFLAYGITWMILFPLAAFYNDLNPVIREFWHIFGPFGPAIAGIVIIKYWKGKEGLKELLRRCLKYSGIPMLIFALIPLITFLIVFPIEHFTGIFTVDMLLNALNEEYLGYVWLFPLASISYGIFEEIGWRGFLLPSLQRKWNPLISSIIMTPIWWLWHLPAFFYRYELFFALSFMPILMFSGILVFTFLFNQSKGSVLMVMILHVSYDLISAHNTGSSTMVVSIIWIILDILILIYYLYNYKQKKEMQKRIIINKSN